MKKHASYAKKALVMMKKILKLGIIVIILVNIGAVHNACNLQYKVPKNIVVVFHNGPYYDFHLVINQPAQDFDVPFNC